MDVSKKEISNADGTLLIIDDWWLSGMFSGYYSVRCHLQFGDSVSMVSRAVPEELFGEDNLHFTKEP